MAILTLDFWRKYHCAFVLATVCGTLGMNGDKSERTWREKKNNRRMKRGATMDAGRQNELKIGKKEKTRFENVHLITTLPLLEPPNARTMADSPREQKLFLSTGGALKQVKKSPPPRRPRKKKMKKFISSFVAMIGLTSKYNTSQVNSRNLFTGRQNYLK